MSPWKTLLNKSIYRLDKSVDYLKYRLDDSFSSEDVVVCPYLSYGTREKLYVRGRVLRAKELEPAQSDSSLWDNLKNTYKRFDSDELPYARVRAYYQAHRVTLEADEEGFFEAWLELKVPLAKDAETWQIVRLELDELHQVQTERRFDASIMVPDTRAQFGIVSDIDDTVLQTGATDLLSMLKKVLFGNAHTRLPFEGVAEFYQSLQHGVNPIFYVSSSPWNLYDVLLEFLDIQNLPAGPLILRDWGVSATEFLPIGHKDHKLKVIRHIFETYSNLPFILIGDSSQEDPEIYNELVRDFPDRVLAVYIRDVSENHQRKEQIRNLAHVLSAQGIDLILSPNTTLAKEHASMRGWLG